jgi:hypothetical protein
MFIDPPGAEETDFPHELNEQRFEREAVWEEDILDIGVTVGEDVLPDRLPCVGLIRLRSDFHTPPSSVLIDAYGCNVHR